MNARINKSKLNLTIDIIMFVVLMAIAGIGFMIKYVLIPGFKRNEIYGKDVELYFFGGDRHQWGSIHLILSFTLLFLLLLHIVFHWKPIVCIFKCMVSAKAWRIAFTSVFIVVSIVLGIMPLFLKPEICEVVSPHYRASELSNIIHSKKGYSIATIKSNQPLISEPISANQKVNKELDDENKSKQDRKHREQSDIEVYGYMTLYDVARKYNISTTELALCIHVPEGHTNVRLGRLMKQFDFHLNDLRDFIESKQKKQ